jgi:DNA-binding NtrC family response regulator
VGGQKELPLRARIIAATNRNLKTEAQAGRFREDLFYRLNVIRVKLPPLRDRGGDITLLAGTFMREFDARLGKNFGALAPEARAALENYNWPGNIRELRNVIERIVLMETGETILLDHLPEEIRRPNFCEAHWRTSGWSNANDMCLSKMEREQIERALKAAGGNVVRAARLLNLKRGALRYRMEKFGILPEKYIFNFDFGPALERPDNQAVQNAPCVAGPGAQAEG